MTTRSAHKREETSLHLARLDAELTNLKATIETKRQTSEAFRTSTTALLVDISRRLNIREPSPPTPTPALPAAQPSHPTPTPALSLPSRALPHLRQPFLCPAAASHSSSAEVLQASPHPPATLSSFPAAPPQLHKPRQPTHFSLPDCRPHFPPFSAQPALLAVPPRPPPQPFPALLPPPPQPRSGTAPSPTVIRLTPTQMTERKTQGLCFKCDEQYHRGHTCKATLFSFVLTYDEEEAEFSSLADHTLSLPPDNPAITYHAFARFPP